MSYNNAAGGVNNVVPTISDTGSGDQWSQVANGGVAGRIEYSNAKVLGGGLCYRSYTRATSEGEYTAWDNGAAVTVMYGGCIFLVDVADITNNTRLVQWKNTSAGVAIGYINLSTAEKIALRHGTDAGAVFTSTLTIAVDTCYRLSYKVSVNGTSTATARLRIHPQTAGGAMDSTILEDSGDLSINIQSATSVASFNHVRYGNTTTQASAPDATAGMLYWDDLYAFLPSWPVVVPRAISLLL